MSDLLSTNKAGRLRGITGARILQLIKDGTLPATQPFGEGPWAVKREDVMALELPGSGGHKKAENIIRDTQILELAASGLGPTAIGNKLGISRQRVDQIVNDVRTAANRAVTDAVKSGKLIPAKHCTVCRKASGRLNAHHQNYSEPLRVQWLCAVCHKAEHLHLNNGKRSSKNTAK